MEKAMEMYAEETNIIHMVRKRRLYMESLKLMIGVETINDIYNKVKKFTIYETARSQQNNENENAQLS